MVADGVIDERSVTPVKCLVDNESDTDIAVRVVEFTEDVEVSVVISVPADILDD